MNLDSNKKVPELRFRDDEGKEYPDWKIRLLEDIVKFSKGRGISRADITDDGSCKCIRYGELYTLYKETISDVYSKTNVPVSQLFLSQKYDVVIPASGETALDIVSASCVLISGVALGGDVNVLRSQQNGIFLAYYLNSKRRGISRFAQGISVIHLYAAHLKRIPIALPCIQEQQKIASFLSSIDTRIEQLKRKKSLLDQYKKGLIQKLFSQEIRFKDDEGEKYPEWEGSKIGLVFSERREIGKPDHAMLSVTISDGVVRASDLGRRDTSSVDKSKYKRVVIGDIPYNSMRMWQGASGVSEFDGIVSPAYTVLIPKNGQVSQYWGYCFKLKRVLHLFQRFSQGLTSDNWNLKYPVISQIKVSVPTEEEQQKIANFLSSIDKKIKLTSDQINQTREFRTGLLQQMFV